MKERITRIAGVLSLAAAIVATAAWVFVPHLRANRAESFSLQPRGIMGTDCRLTAVVHPDGAKTALADAEAQLRRVEALMSTHLASSELSQLNAAGPGELIALSPEVVDLLRATRSLAEQTDGTFDVTVKPLIDLWTQAALSGRLPRAKQIDEARTRIGWDGIEILDGGAKKRRGSVRIDLGGIAKGYGIDLAIAALKRHGCAGGLVDVGGDIRCFGSAPKGRPWRIGIRDPFHPQGHKMLAVLNVSSGAVCTSGNYFRYSEIDGRRYSHIIDPRTGRPAEAAPSVTVWAPTATVADAWATALSVLGVEGIELAEAEAGIEAMIVTGTAAEYKLTMTEGFYRLLRGGEPATQADQ